MWSFFASISIASIAVANLFQKVAMRKKDSDPIVSSIVFQSLVTLFTLVFALIKGFQLPPISTLWPHFIISSAFYGFGTLFIFKAIKEIEASELSIVASFGSLATIFTAFIFLDERLSLLQIFGVFLILSSVFLINKAKGQIKFDKGLFYALIGNSLYGFAVTNDAFILKSYDAISYTPIISFLPGVILLLIYFPKIKSKFKNSRLSIDKNLVIYTALYGIQAVTYYLSLENGALASQMASVFKTEMVLTVFLAAIFLGERKNLLIKAAAMSIAIIGSILVIR